MNTKSLLPNARRLSDTLYGIKLALMILAVIAGSILVLVGMFATDGYGDSAPDGGSVVAGLVTILTAVWVYALFGFGEYVIRLLAKLVEQQDAGDFEVHVATAPLDSIKTAMQDIGKAVQKP